MSILPSELSHHRIAEPLASVIIPNWNGAHLLGSSLCSLRSQSYQKLEVIVVDGGSSDGSVHLVAERFPEVRLVRLAGNRGFSGNVNAGLRVAQGDVLALLNNDAEAEPEWLAELVTALELNPLAGSFASKILHQRDRNLIASAGDLLGRDGLAVQRGNGELEGGPRGRRPAQRRGGQRCV